MLVKLSDSEYSGKSAHLFECDICHKHFHRGASGLKTKNHFCSVKCRNDFQATKKNRLQFVCPNCGKNFERVAAHVLTERPFCSRPCARSFQMKEQWQDSEFREKQIEHARSQWTPKKRKAHAEKMSGPDNPVWKGGRTNSKGRYPAVRCPPEFQEMAQECGYVLEHRLMMAQYLGRPLQANEVVHHKSGNVLDNRIENLELFPSHSDHLAQTMKRQT